MNQVIFLDYYHPYAGLCNQLYLVTNHLHSSIKQNTKIYINKVNIDIFKKNRIPAEDFFDLQKTNSNLKKLIGWEPILYKCPKSNFTIPRLCIYPVSSIEILNCLEFQERFYELVPKKEYNGIHFRIELDSIISYLFNENCYNHFMNNCNNEFNFTSFINSPEIKKYIDYLLSQYFKYILHFGFNIPWFISTSIGKKEIHNCLIPTFKRLTDFIESNSGIYFQNEQNFKERELNALIDLLTLKKSKNIIGFEGSSYSEGYCYKVNSINKEVKDFRFVYGIVGKLPDELYKSFTNDSSIC